MNTQSKLNYEVKHLLTEHKDEIFKQLKALDKLAERMGLPKPQYEIGGDYKHEFSAVVDVDRDEFGQRFEISETFIETCFDLKINLEKSLILDGGWSLVAANDHTFKITNQINPDFEIPNKYVPTYSTCEHCNVKMPRTKSYIIMSESGEFKQVGKTCMKQFIGIDPSKYISMFEAVSKMSITIQNFSYITLKGNKGGCLAYNVEDIFKFTDVVVKKEGKFVKNEWKEEEIVNYWGREETRTVRSNRGKSTYDKVMGIIQLCSDVRMGKFEIDWANEVIQKFKGEFMIREALKKAETSPIEALDMLYDTDGIDLQRVLDMLNKLKSAIYIKEQHNLYNEVMQPLSVEQTEKFEGAKKWFSEMVVEGQRSYDLFLMGVKDVFKDKRTLQINAKYIVSGYNIYEKSLIKVEKPISEFVGIVGEKRNLSLKVVSYKEGNGAYGTWQLWTMEDSSGNRFNKFGVLSEKYVNGDLGIFRFPNDFTEDEKAAGVSIYASFEIKAHKDFKGVKTTELGRISKPEKINC